MFTKKPQPPGYISILEMDKMRDAKNLRALKDLILNLGARKLNVSQIQTLIKKVQSLYILDPKEEQRDDKQSLFEILNQCLKSCRSAESLLLIKAFYQSFGFDWAKICNDNSQLILTHNLFESLFKNRAYIELQIFDILTQEAKLIFFIRFIKHCCEQGLLEDLAYVYQLDIPNFSDAANSKELGQYKDFLAMCVEFNFASKFKIMAQFHSTPGKINYEGALTVCAAIAEKNPDFVPVVLNSTQNYDELREFFNFIKQNREAINGQTFAFISAGRHWINGVIRVQADSIDLLFVDPLGSKAFDANLFDPLYEKTLREVVQECLGTTVHILVAEQPRQYSLVGCSVYAIDDARKISKWNKSEPFSEHLPLTMLRITQSITEIKKIQQDPYYAEKLAMPINKRALTYMESIDEHTINLTEDRTDRKKFNKRIEHKLNMLSEKVASFMKAHSDDELQTAKFKFAILAFKLQVIQRGVNHATWQ
jgi:hypothetical protein